MSRNLWFFGAEKRPVPAAGAARENRPPDPGVPQPALHHRLQPHHPARGESKINREFGIPEKNPDVPKKNPEKIGNSGRNRRNFEGKNRKIFSEKSQNPLEKSQIFLLKILKYLGEPEILGKIQKFPKKSPKKSEILGGISEVLRGKNCKISRKKSQNSQGKSQNFRGNPEIFGGS